MFQAGILNPSENILVKVFTVVREQPILRRSWRWKIQLALEI
jgi:hypothetical protein